MTDWECIARDGFTQLQSFRIDFHHLYGCMVCDIGLDIVRMILLVRTIRRSDIDHRVLDRLRYKDSEVFSGSYDSLWISFGLSSDFWCVRLRLLPHQEGMPTVGLITSFSRDGCTFLVAVVLPTCVSE